MRDKDLIRKLHMAYEAPDPAGKDAFIRKAGRMQPRRSMSFTQMLMIQLRYISKSVWAVSFLAVILTMAGLSVIPDEGLSVLADLMPLLAGLGMIETFRAHMHGMDELEKATLISAKGALFARMAVTGLVHLITMLIISALMTVLRGGQIVNAGLSLMIPYLITCIACMETERTGFGRDNIWCCLGVSAAVIALREIVLATFALSKAGTDMMILITLILALIQIYEIRKTLVSEELAWN